MHMGDKKRYKSKKTFVKYMLLHIPKCAEHVNYTLSRIQEAPRHVNYESEGHAALRYMHLAYTKRSLLHFLS